MFTLVGPVVGSIVSCFRDGKKVIGKIEWVTFDGNENRAAIRLKCGKLILVPLQMCVLVAIEYDKKIYDIHCNEIEQELLYEG